MHRSGRHAYKKNNICTVLVVPDKETEERVADAGLALRFAAIDKRLFVSNYQLGIH
jgi:hypothetical protein